MKVFIRSTIPLTLIAAIIIAVASFRPTGLSHAVTASAHDTMGSKNYAGYASRNNGSHATKFTSVTGSWQVPSVKCAKANQALAIWVGIGGLTKAKDLEQAGTLTLCGSDLQPQYAAFYEILPAATQSPNLPVNPGDHISASVTFVGNGVFKFQIQDSTQHWSFSHQGHKSGAHLASADCIVEAPSNLSNHVLPLVKFSTVNFSGCRANGKPINAGPSTAEIFMVSVNNPGDARALPSDLSANGTAFSVTWERS